MDVLRCAFVVSFLVACCAIELRGDDSLPADVMQQIKNATVYVKTQMGPVMMSGSGFVIDVTGNTALIASNRHVVVKPKELKVGGHIPGLRGHDRFTLMRIQKALATAETSVSVVFNSGNSNEQSIKAELLGELEQPDLAILRVSGITTPPTPISFRQPTPLTETMGLFVFGFPFGEKLAMNKGNPAITIGKGSLSSIRKDETGKVTMLQIDGALNPGNSGGPVVDPKGNLAGIAVQTIQGSNIGLVIPPGELARILDGTVGKPTIAFGPLEKGSMPAIVVSVPLADPMNKVKSVALHVVEGSSAVKANKKAIPPLKLESVSGSRKLELTVRDRVAKAALSSPDAGDQKGREISVQAEFVNSDGKTILMDPVILQVPSLQVTMAKVENDGKEEKEEMENEKVAKKSTSNNGGDKTTTKSTGKSTDKKSALVGGPGGAPFEQGLGGKKMIGVDWKPGKWAGVDTIGVIRPVAAAGNPEAGFERVIAPKGYAVGGMNVYATNLVCNIQLIYMKMRSDGTLDPEETELSEWLGGEPDGDVTQLTGEGKRVTGLYGRGLAVVDAIGLLFQTK